MGKEEIQESEPLRIYLNEIGAVSYTHLVNL